LLFFYSLLCLGRLVQTAFVELQLAHPWPWNWLRKDKKNKDKRRYVMLSYKVNPSIKHAELNWSCFDFSSSNSNLQGHILRAQLEMHLEQAPMVVLNMWPCKNIFSHASLVLYFLSCNPTHETWN
jgi:hypothetical protein